MDKRIGLFCEEEPKEERDKDIFTGVDLVATSKNPLLRQVGDEKRREQYTRKENE